MARVNAGFVAIAALLGALSGCDVQPPKENPLRSLSSEGVVRELHETRPAFTALTPHEQAQVHGWLLTRCVVGAEADRAQLQKLGRRTEEAFIEAFGMGPPTALLAEIAEQRRSDFGGIQQRLDGEDAALFDARMRRRLKALSEDDYVKAGVDGTIAGYRIAALDALSVVGSKTAVAWLERRVPAIENAELKSAAARTLAALRERQGPVTK